ncbi:hypothetical protein RHGRI_006027 [Rhododendron griersonianum]|uniref:Uncharacterized protein n=1 Tax=Rhododendron griersonianum TaxID=479676 RepID=A0AAV6LFG0_9ERIC|nr:hypothetical protein RHGRI_006027 [Rhododendron griersonianum]
MSSQICRSASRAARSLLSASKQTSHQALSAVEGRATAAAATVLIRGKVPSLASYGRTTSGGWVSGALALPAAAYMLQEQEAHAAEMERTFIAISLMECNEGCPFSCLGHVQLFGRHLLNVSASYFVVSSSSGAWQNPERVA